MFIMLQNGRNVTQVRYNDRSRGAQFQKKHLDK